MNFVTLTDSQIIDILNECGIKVSYKPVVYMQQHHIGDASKIIELDIREAY